MAHTHYKGTGKIQSFRGRLEDGGQDKISIQGSVGAVAWRISKFECMQDGFGNSEMVVKIYRENQTGISSSIDFREDELLAACMISASSSSESNPDDIIVIFDNALFVRNIWISAASSSNADPTNYYIELEEVKVGKAGMAQLAVAAARRDPSLT